MVVGRPYRIIAEEATNSAGVRATLKGSFARSPNYPLTIGRSVDGILRMVAALQATHSGHKTGPCGLAAKSSGPSYRPTKRSSKKPTGFAGAKSEAHLTIPESRLNPPPIRNANQLKTLATPPGFEPGTFSLEGARSRNDFSARSDIFAFRASFEATAEFPFVGMPPSRLLAKPAPEPVAKPTATTSPWPVDTTSEEAPHPLVKPQLKPNSRAQPIIAAIVTPNELRKTI
jgi:hypothetical protein